MTTIRNRTIQLALLLSLVGSTVTAFVTTGVEKRSFRFSSPSPSSSSPSASSYPHSIPSQQLFYGPETNIDNSEELFTSPVLKQLAPDLLQWKNEYGHPNIPLKNPGGNQCQTLRRLHIQNKLSEAEVEWLESIGFVFHSMEDVYKYADFDELFQRLVAYEASHPDSNFQVPKKLKEDPELGAWVTGLRRLGQDGVNPEHERRLNEIGFAWFSTRKCGSKFMTRYRELAQEVEQRGLEDVLADPATVSWIQAQQEALKRGGLSQTRVHYMGSMFGESWTTLGKQKPATTP